MSDTPRTDENISEHYDEMCDDTFEYVNVGIARKLERELNEAKQDVIRMQKEANESFQQWQEARQQFRDGTWHGKTTEDYMSSVSVDPDEHTAFFSLEYQWQDKPHRHIFDLCDWINQLQDEIKQLKSI